MRLLGQTLSSAFSCKFCSMTACTSSHSAELPKHGSLPLMEIAWAFKSISTTYPRRLNQLHHICACFLIELLLELKYSALQDFRLRRTCAPM